MPGLTSGLYVGLTGLTTAQSAIAVTGHNIANVNTDGYSRQQAVITSNTALYEGNCFFGMGASLQSVQGIRDQLLNLQLTGALSQQAGSEARYESLTSLSTLFQSDSTTGMAAQLNTFFTNMQKVAAQPEDASLRTAFVSSAQNLVSALQTKYQALQTAQQTADATATAYLPQINAITKQIAALNQKLAGESNNTADNDAVDQRQALAEQLSQLVGTQTYVDDKNQMNITLDNGAAPLVTGATASTLVAQQYTTAPAGQPQPTAPFFNHVYIKESGADVTSSIVNGKLGAQLDVRDNIISGYLQQLDQFTAGLAYNINTLNSAGTDMKGASNNEDFFVGGTGNTNHLPTGVQVPPDTAGQTPNNDYKGTVMSLRVNAAIVADPTRFAAGSTGATGDNTNVAKMIKLQTASNTVDLTGAGPTAASSGTFNTVISSLVAKVGDDAASWKTTSTNQENIATALKTQRSSVSGVDLDTEAANLITYQRAYQASAQFISVINQLTSQLIQTLS
jgi:flagellar hook-associated protein 1